MGFLRDNAPFLTAGALLSFSSSYGQTFFIAIFGASVMAALDLSAGDWGLIYGIATTVSAVVMVQAGALTDRFRVRHLAIGVMVLMAAACLLMASVDSVPALLLAVFLLRLTGQGMMSHLSVVAMARWFRANRGKALSVSALGFAVGTAVLPALVAALMTVFDWRLIWVGAAAAALLTLPVIVRLLRQERTPQAAVEETASLGMEGRHWRRAEVLRHPLFWCLVPLLLGPPCWGTALWFQQVHIAEVKGWSLLAYASLFPLLMAVAVATTVLSGIAIDRLGAARLLPVYLLPFALGFALLAWAPTIPAAALALVVMGIGQGMQSTVPSAFWAEFFGTRHLGAIKAAAGAIMVFGSAIGPAVSGALIDAGVAFPAQSIGFAAFFVAAAGLTTLAVARYRGTLPVAAQVDV